MGIESIWNLRKGTNNSFYRAQIQHSRGKDPKLKNEFTGSKKLELKSLLSASSYSAWKVMGLYPLKHGDLVGSE